MSKHPTNTVSPQGLDLQERVIEINRVAKVVKGGRRFSFTALVAVGDESSVVGVGYGKAREVPLAIQKGVEDARKNLIKVPMFGQTLPHEINGRYGAGHVVMRPASPGTGVIAGGGVRAVLELAGIRDVLTKSLGTQNPINLVRATMDGLIRLRRPEDVAELRGLSIREVLGIFDNGSAEKVKAQTKDVTPKPVDAVEDAGAGEAQPSEAADTAPPTEAGAAVAEAAEPEAAPTGAEAAPTGSAPQPTEAAEPAPSQSEDEPAAEESAAEKPAAEKPAEES